MSLVAKFGNRLSKEGIPALKEWQEIVSKPGTQTSCKSFERILFNQEGVKKAPEPKTKTGLFVS